MAGDIAAPISQLPKLLGVIGERVRKYDLPFVVLGHAKDGNLHPKIMSDPANPDEVARMEMGLKEIFSLACDLGGEHGIGLSKAPCMTMEHDSVGPGPDALHQASAGPQQHPEPRQDGPGGRFRFTGPGQQSAGPRGPIRRLIRRRALGAALINKAGGNSGPFRNCLPHFLLDSKGLSR